MHVTGIVVDLRTDRAKRALERLARKRVQPQLNSLTDLEFRKILLRQVEINKHRIDLLHSHDHRAGIQVRTGIDRDDAGTAGKRRTQQLLGDVHLLLLHRRLLGFEIRRCLVKVGLTDCLHRQLFLHTTEGHLGKHGSGFELMQLGDILSVAQLQQHLAFLDLLAGLHIHSRHQTGDVERQIGSAHRTQRAHRT